MRIDAKDISVIVQGPVVKKETAKCLKSIRRFLAGAEIILSTYDGEEVANLDYDILVSNDDPAAAVIERKGGKTSYNNINRQLFSTQEGLKKARRKYALKLRSDLILTSDKFLDYFDRFPKRIDDYRLFEKKILTAALYTRFTIRNGKPAKRVKIPFHVSDWWLFGLREDVNKYFLDTPLVREPEFTNYFALKGNERKKSPYGKVRFKFAPEQYFGYECFKRNFAGIYMEDAADYSDELMEKSRKCLVNNFITLEFAQSGIYLNKYPFSKNEKMLGDPYIGLYNFHRYEAEYRKYCDPCYEITTNDSLFDSERLGYARLRLHKHLARLTDSETSVLQKMENLFIGIPVAGAGYISAVIKEKTQSKR